MAAPSPFFPPPPGGRYRSQSYQPAATAVPSHSALGQRAALPTAISQDRFIRQGLPPPHQSRAISHRYSHSHNPTNASVPLPPPPIFPPGTRPTISTTPSAPTRPRPIHEVREEDECPVCGAEFPSGDVLAREAHIQDCIAARFSSTPSSSSMPRPPPQQPQHPPPDQQAAPEPSSVATGSTPPTTAALLRPRAQSAFRPRGMALYTATEKDCLDSSGETQECVICFEEFQPGDELGRMECLCKFHRGCIRGWWDVQAQRGRAQSRWSTTSTTTTTPAALTVAASAGFTPFASQLAADGYSFSEKRKRYWSELDDSTEDPKPLAARNAATTTCKISVSGGQVVISPTQYPKSAGCLKLAEVVTMTFVTKTAASTLTITAATPITTSVTTTTVTIIATSVAPAPSPFYAACAPDNQVTHIAGNSVDGIQFSLGGPESSFSIGGGGSAYDCCVRCITYPFAPCVGYVYLFAPVDSCYFATANFGGV
ncbi:hypothetical protein LTS01_004993 [Friedmanniomyces endolithicus]|nr:hypothetical protein LTS01_004993 [Friedmanniomyces endolithicus]